MLQNPLLSPVIAAEKTVVGQPNNPLPSRSVHINALKNTPEFDVLVIGGGASGCGVALDAVTRGKQEFILKYIVKKSIWPGVCSVIEHRWGHPAKQSLLSMQSVLLEHRFELRPRCTCYRGLGYNHPFIYKWMLMLKKENSLMRENKID